MIDPRERFPHPMASALQEHPANQGYEIPHGLGDSVAVLDGRPGDEVKLEGEGGIGYYEWSTRRRAALDLEVRARIVGTTAPIGTTPVVHFALELGHGAITWNLPVPPLPVISGTRHELPILPGRGLLLRVSARRLKLTFIAGVDLDGDAVDTIKLAVSVQPSGGDRCCNADAYAQYGDPALGPPPPHLQPFPMGAREFMLRTYDTSERFENNDCAVIFSSLAGELFGPVDAFSAGYGDWTPIPVHAVALLTDVACEVLYR